MPKNRSPQFPGSANVTWAKGGGGVKKWGLFWCPKRTGACRKLDKLPFLASSVHARVGTVAIRLQKERAEDFRLQEKAEP